MTTLTISWATKKESNGLFSAIVTGSGYNQYEELKKIEGFSSRAKAVATAKKWVRHMKAQQKAVA